MWGTREIRDDSYCISLTLSSSKKIFASLRRLPSVGEL